MVRDMEQVGELFNNLPIVKKAKREVAFTESHRKLLDAAVVIRLDPYAVERAYMARQLVQCTLPHRNPGKVEAWVRRDGRAALVIQPGWDARKNCSLGVPYGALARLLLFWIITEAVRTKSRRLELGASLSGFLRELGLTGQGGKNSPAKRLRAQMQRLFAARISFQGSIEAGGVSGERWLNMEVAPKGELWWDLREPEQAALWESWIELGEEFFAAIIAAPVPVDMRVLRAIKRSPLALDLYAWVTYRVFQVNKKGAAFVPWAGLQKQMGGEYKSVDEFARNAKKAFRRIRTVYPRLNLKYRKGGLVLEPSPTSVPVLPAGGSCAS
jgi:hypothetical protein